MVNPNLLSMKAHRVWLDSPTEGLKEETISKLEVLSNVRVVYDYAGLSTSFVIVCANRDEPSAQVASGGISLAQEAFFATMKFPNSDAVLSENDWGIYKSIRDDPRKPRSAISRETGLSDRTIKRRVEALVTRNAILMAPNLDMAGIDGVAAEILVKCSGSEANHLEQTIASEANDSLIHIERFEEPCVLFSLIATNAARAWKIFEQAKVQPGVANACLYLLKRTSRHRTPLHLPSGPAN
jgi:hypothetical protein